ncbi:hypothetical protein DICPUDRAFT_75559 [Dictyostelium purpureum]|uniref:Uncharacterized protein n=1 Tax=Dictyostelium purpureum TaxID=5786 RepID=F0ZB05_DICPU|nr:uncharacterized protein DICPUDRAFT_75559 [Dictyostelium purpureum]EGC38921.1 hypothetical protein DICPUDRAFT_75559 [Dictyostelium purpureum]|eukprot:XP_003284601.1 hypothetical protein DICPUDRAFT_75559 [Dictyostelium purpureum]
MLIFKSLVLLTVLLSANFASALLPPSPGSIDPNQFNDIPSVIYYGLGNDNGIQPIAPGCNNGLIKNVGANSPIVILNETAYLATTYNNNELDISIITRDGGFSIYQQPNLRNFLKQNPMDSLISYDDYRNSFLFISGSKIIDYGIAHDIINVMGADLNTPYPNPYFDLKTSTYYVATYQNNNNLVQNYYVYAPLQGEFSLFSVNNLNLTYSLDAVQIASYGSKVILFGNNKSQQQSYLYSVYPFENSYTLLAIRDYGYQLTTGINSRFVLLSSSTGDQTELYDLEFQGSQKYLNTCFKSNSQNSFISSIATKQIFSN